MSEYHHQSQRSTVNSISQEDQARFENSRKIYKLLKKLDCHDCCQRCCCSGCCGCSSCHTQKCVYKIIKKLCKNALRELIEEAKANCERDARASQEQYKYQQPCEYDGSSGKSSSCSSSRSESIENVVSAPIQKPTCPPEPPEPLPFCKGRRSSLNSEKRPSKLAKDHCSEVRKSKQISNSPCSRNSKIKPKRSSKNENCDEGIKKQSNIVIPTIVVTDTCTPQYLEPEEKCVEEQPKKPKKPKCNVKAKTPQKKNTQPLQPKELCKQPSSCDRQSMCSQDARFDDKTKCSDYLRCNMEKKDPYRQSQNCDGGVDESYGGYPPQKCQVSYSTFCGKNLVPNNSMCSNNLH